MNRSFDEIMETGVKNALERIPSFIEEREQEKKLNKYPHKRNLKSRTKKR